MSALWFILWLYRAAWPLELLFGVPLVVVAINSLTTTNGQLAIRSKKWFVWCGSLAAILLFPSLSFLANVELGEARRPEVVVSPDSKCEVLFSFRSTSRSLDFIDPSCRMYAQVRNRASGKIEGEVRIDLHEIGDFDRPQLEWRSESVKVRFYRHAFEIARKA